MTEPTPADQNRHEITPEEKIIMEFGLEDHVNALSQFYAGPRPRFEDAQNYILSINKDDPRRPNKKHIFSLGYLEGDDFFGLPAEYAKEIASIEEYVEKEFRSIGKLYRVIDEKDSKLKGVYSAAFPDGQYHGTDRKVPGKICRAWAKLKEKIGKKEAIDIDEASYPEIFGELKERCRHIRSAAVAPATRTDLLAAIDEETERAARDESASPSDAEAIPVYAAKALAAKDAKEIFEQYERTKNSGKRFEAMSMAAIGDLLGKIGYIERMHKDCQAGVIVLEDYNRKAITHFTGEDRNLLRGGLAQIDHCLNQRLEGLRIVSKTSADVAKNLREKLNKVYDKYADVYKRNHQGQEPAPLMDITRNYFQHGNASNIADSVDQHWDYLENAHATAETPARTGR